MQWVVGTGRCGLHNYTALNGGWIQSKKDWKTMVVNRYHDKEWDKKLVESVIKERMAMPYPCITDCAQFMFIDIIRKVDKKANFVWVIRDKDNCVKSFMRRVGEDNRIHPIGWKFERDRKKELIEWYYEEVNNIIRDKLEGADYKIVYTEDMPRASEDKVEALRAYA